MTPRRIPLKQIGVVGDRGEAGDGWRIELAVVARGGADGPDLLHDEKVPDFSLVHRGQVRLGGLVQFVAVKLQREHARNGEEAASVRAKFDLERKAYLAVQADGGPRPAIVRLHDLGPEAKSDHAAEFPPCVVCRHARHALRPVCTACGGELREHEQDGRRVLRCLGDGCKTDHGPAAKAALVRTVARRDPACVGCDKDEATCAASAFVLCLFPTRVLVFERLDIDLEDFLAGKAQTDARAGRPEFWKAYERLPGRADPTPDAELAEAVGLFKQLVAAAARLHGLGITHYDLKPRNVCLAVRDGQLLVRVIDLGFADAPRDLAFLMQAQGMRSLHTVYAAPEMVRPASGRFRAAVSLEAGQAWCRLDKVLDLGSHLDSLAEPGDLIDLRVAGQDRVVWSTTVAEVRPEPPSAVGLRLGGTPPRVEPRYEAEILKQAGPAADAFSLGMVLLVLLTHEFGQAATIREKVGGWLAARANGQPIADESFKLLEGSLARFGPALRPLALGLLDLALRLLARSPAAPLSAVAQSRADRKPDLASVTDELEWVEDCLEGRRRRAEQEADRDRLREVSRWLLTRVAEKKADRPDVPYEPDQLDAALRVRARSAALRGRELKQLLRKYTGRPDLLRGHLERLLGDAPVPIKPSAAALNERQFRTLSAVLRFGVPFGDMAGELDRLAVLEEAGRGKTGVTAAWLKEAGPLAERVHDFREPYFCVERAARTVRSLFLEALDQERAKRPARPLEFVLGKSLRDLVAERAALKGVERLRSAVDWGKEIHAALDSRWSEALKEWAGLPASYRSALGPCFDAAREEQAALRQTQRGWAEAVSRCLDRLSGHFDRVSGGVLAAWDRARRPGLFATPAFATVRIDPGKAALPSAAELTAAVEELRALHLGPAASIAARLLIEQIRRQRPAGGG